MKNMNFPQAGELHRRAGQQAAPQDGQVGCRKGHAGGLYKKAARQAAKKGPPFCLVCSSPPACRKFTFSNWKHGPPISVIPFVVMFIDWQMCGFSLNIPTDLSHYLCLKSLSLSVPQ